MNFNLNLTPEELLAYEFATRWRDENYRPALHPALHPASQDIDWLRFAEILTHNRMSVLAMKIFKRVDSSIPVEARKLIREQAEKHERSASKFGNALITYLKSADARGIKTIVLKVLGMAEKIIKILPCGRA